MRIDPNEFLALDLEVHAVLKGVPLNDVSVVDLPGGGPGRTIDDLRRLLDFGETGMASGPARALFVLRSWLGKVFGWDQEAPAEAKVKTSDRVPSQLEARSTRDPGSLDGPFRLLYQLDDEMLSEVSNATVHAFSCMVLRQTHDGYRFYWAVYVAPVSRFTPFYMALIEPFRRFIVYPSILKRSRADWITKMAV